MLVDIASFQFKERKKTIICFFISCVLISAHYFLLWETSAWFIVSLSAIRYIISYFSTDKRIMLVFIALNTIILSITFKELQDLIFFAWITISMIWSFQDQKHNKLMRLLMMCWTLLVITYNTIIMSPMAILTEVIFLSSNLVWYYRFYFKKKE